MKDLPFSPNALTMVVVAALIGWRLYARFRRLIGRQRVVRRRLVFSVIFFPMLILVLGVSAARSEALVEALVAGVALGIALGCVGVKLTRFESGDAGLFSTPNTILGVAVMLLFVGRLAYRLGTLFLVRGPLDTATMQSFGSSPLTLAIFGVVAAYYTSFAAGILLWSRKTRTPVAPPAALPGTPAG